MKKKTYQSIRKIPVLGALVQSVLNLVVSSATGFKRLEKYAAEHPDEQITLFTLLKINK